MRHRQVTKPPVAEGSSIDGAAVGDEAPSIDEPTHGALTGDRALGIDSAAEMNPVHDKASPTSKARDDQSSLAATLPFLDKLCSGVSVREFFLKEYGKEIDERVKILRAERVASGEGTLNPAGIFQEVQKKLWLSLSSETKDELKRKVQALNSDTKR